MWDCVYICWLKHGQKIQGSDASASAMPHPVVSSMPEHEEDIGKTRVRSVGGHQDDQGLEHLPCEQRPRERRIHHGVEVISQGPDSCLLEHAGRLFEKMESGCGRTRDNNCKLMQECFWLESRENFPAWNSQVLEGLSREFVQSPSVGVLWLDWIKPWAVCLFWTEH